MNAWQVSKQLRQILRDLTWGDGDDAPVFGDVHVTGSLPKDLDFQELQVPFAILVIAGATPDASEPQLVEQTIEVGIAVAVEGDAIGEVAIIGGARPDTAAAFGQGTSKGRGLLEVEEIAFAATEKLDNTAGVAVRTGRSTSSAVLARPDVGWVAIRATSLLARTTRARFYHPARAFQGADAGVPGDADLTWKSPPTRHDRFRLIIRRAAGAVPPATPTAGTDIPVVGFVELLTDDPGAGTFSYAIFVSYDETNDAGALAEDQRFSVADTIVSLVVT